MSQTRRAKREHSRFSSKSGVSVYHAIKKVDEYYGKLKDKTEEEIIVASKSNSKYLREAANLILDNKPNS